MDIRVDARALQTELTLALGIVETKATIPILSNLLLRAEGNHLELAATDLEVTLRTHCPAEVFEPGAITVSAKTFGPIVRAFSGQNAPLSLKSTPERKLFLQPEGGKQQYLLQTLPEEDYPTLLEAGEGESVLLPTGVFKKLVLEALVSVGLDDNRYSIRGGLMIMETGHLTLVSTDSHRLTFTQWKGELDVPTPRRALIPRKTLAEFLKLEDGEEVKLSFRDNHIFIELGNRLLYSRLMDTTFPAYERVLPNDTNKTALINRLAFLERIKRVAMVAESKTRAATLIFDPSGTLELLVRNQETGDEGREYLTCERYEGEAVTMCFNVDFIIDFLNAVDCEKVQVSLRDTNYQAVLSQDRPEEEGVHRYVVMPLRLD
jgi:DNA polymerase-3 subunit beta